MHRFIIFLIAVVIVLYRAAPGFAACPVLATAGVQKVTWDESGQASISTGTSSVSATAKGTIIYDTSDNLVKYCDGVNWYSVMRVTAS